ncbi:MAG: uracil-DNA glycosylase family protein [Spirochaetaceae bacterium]|jgi:hypothetical protein|nr:uracil-DNA glycosylase family protein [Spirochaetaceae bacterium]
MKTKAWQALRVAVKEYRDYVADLDRRLPALKGLTQALVDGRGGPAYTVEHPVLYNGALDELEGGSGIRLILVGDNPGRREQEQGRYLVGPSGKIAESFFRKHPELGIDFRLDVIILNKTPVHTPRTAELRELGRSGGLEQVLAESQRFMANIIHRFHTALAPLPVWIIGYSEMKKGGIFEVFTESLKSLYAKSPARKKELFLFRHFSMNQFTIDLKRQAKGKEGTAAALDRIGAAYRNRVFGW